MNTETTKTIEQLKAELEIAEQKLREEKEAIARQELEVKMEAERIQREAEEKAHMEKMAAFAVHIVDELKKVGFKDAHYTLPESGEYPMIHCTTADSEFQWAVRFEKVYGGGHRYGRSWVETKVTVGGYESQSRFPILKKGGYNYAKIAATAWEKYQQAIAKQDRENKNASNEKSNKARVQRIAAQFDIEGYQSGVKISHYDYHHSSNPRDTLTSYYKDNELTLTLKGLSEDEIVLLLQFMKENGIGKLNKTEEK